MMLRIGICLIGFALGCAIFIPRQLGGTFAVVTLVIVGMVLVLISPIGGLDDAAIRQARSGSRAEVRRHKSVVRNRADAPGGDSKEESVGDSSSSTP